jgi:hypothetical protein
MGNKSLYGILLHNIWAFEVKAKQKDDEIRWQVIKAMLDEFPTLREKVKSYLREQERKVG